MNSGDDSTALSAVVLVGGVPIGSDRMDVAAPVLVIAADSGLHQASDLGLEVDLVVGDLDSVEPEALEAARRAGAVVESYPAAKDETDLELALEAARSRGCKTVTVVGGGGGRLDHLLAGLHVLASPRFATMRIQALLPEGRVTVVRDEVVLGGTVGSIVTLLAIGGPANGVTTSGLAFPLDAETLEPMSTRGVSNVIAQPCAAVTVADGVLLAIEPEGK